MRVHLQKNNKKKKSINNGKLGPPLEIITYIRHFYRPIDVKGLKDRVFAGVHLNRAPI